MLETSARLLRLLALLQSPRPWTGGELADRLGVSGRTVRADVERLRSLGYPVEATRGSAGGYRLGAGAAVPPLLLDDEEAVAVAVGLRTATGGSVAGLPEASLRALVKLEQVMPSRLRHRIATLHGATVAVPADSPGPTVAAEVLTALAAACRAHERLRFDYTAHQGAATRREAEPYRLVNWGRRWYLLAWDVDRAAWRTFRADRIVPRVPNGPRFTPRPLPEEDVAAYVSRRASAAAWRYHATVTVRAPAATIAARVSPAVGTVEPVDDASCLLRTGADTVESLAVHLGLLDADFEVTGPPELVAHLRTLADRYAAALPPPGS
ncbi:helix-turn-helix transcriptional regulator [Actinomadura flavalba]|uniref:helix-turn-helix transcriptional regulator n=1 Tax=Actinomadura flavalba TaxID=1120938 RepID=UPI000368009C|nr:YafY family protein [Actinomadura flavalba]